MDATFHEEFLYKSFIEVLLSKLEDKFVIDNSKDSLENNKNLASNLITLELNKLGFFKKVGWQDGSATFQYDYVTRKASGFTHPGEEPLDSHELLVKYPEATKVVPFIQVVFTRKMDGVLYPEVEDETKMNGYYTCVLSLLSTKCNSPEGPKVLSTIDLPSILKNNDVRFAYAPEKILYMLRCLVCRIH